VFRRTNFGYENGKRKILSVACCENSDLQSEINKFIDLYTVKHDAYITVEFTTGVPPYRAPISLPRHLSVNFPELVNLVLLVFSKNTENEGVVEFIRDNTVNKRRF